MTNINKAELSLLRRIPAGEFLMGSDDFYPEEAPSHRVYVDEFEIEVTPVTNSQYSCFVDETGYLTIAEHPLPKAQFPDLSDEQRSPGSMVFYPTAGPVDLENMGRWWGWTRGASWRCPEGVGTSWRDRPDHPVVHIAYEDAKSYAEWAGRALPTEAEWERAARGGVDGKNFIWGDKNMPKNKRMAKYFEGKFPYKNKARDGHLRTAPVASFPANRYGLYDMAGNVWEWTQDWYKDEHEADLEKPCCVPQNPRGGLEEDSLAPDQAPIPRRVLKGGSFLCADEYCMRYRPAARRPQMIDTGMSHIGFRCVCR